MASLYHRVPQTMVGTVLYLLNELKVKHPELYTVYVKKYEGRKETMAQTIPILNCLWNDALHFSPVHPTLVKNALQEAGFEVGPWRFFEVDAARLEPQRTAF